MGDSSPTRVPEEYTFKTPPSISAAASPTRYAAYHALGGKPSALVYSSVISKAGVSNSQPPILRSHVMSPPEGFMCSPP
eukprot:CAMPEP_0113715630 /NCGR_PEP_ID=MMETSP0038_2-20120614/33389_1 /TAXON_ID=2898 /ORGANISM="Cryptomonas paramecium" /LENGTH=78 /DNA_ID=CAMNT_0000642959 /DNA_START=30 /DNA_END=262 /DNA_ORIENTATION=+ /assembly_acc=CAM_ASM_000170